MNQDILEPGFVYHIYNRGNNRENLFIDRQNYSYFLIKAKFFLLPFFDIYASKSFSFASQVEGIK